MHLPVIRTWGSLVVERVIVSSLPFLLAALTQFLGRRVAPYAKRALRILVPMASEHPGSDDRALAVELAVHTYAHLSFVFANLMSSLTCMVYAICGTRPILAALGAAALVILLPIWLFYWQDLSAAQLEGRPGRAMRISSWATIGVLWAATVAAQL